MQRIDIDNIIAFLNTKTSITSLVSNIFGAFPKTQQSKSYIVLNEVSENIDVVEGVARLGFRFIAKNDDTTWAELRTIERAVSNEIAQIGRINMNGFVVNNVKLESNIFRGYDEKERKTYGRDYTFYFLS